MSPVERARLAKSARSLADVIGMTVPLKRVGRWRAACCPFHGEKTASFYVYADHFHCFGCGKHGDVVDWLAWLHRVSMVEALAIAEGGSMPPATVQLPGRPAEQTDSTNFARKVWMESVPAAGTLVETYLASRGLALPSGLVASNPSVIRFHPECPCGRDLVPAMVARMDNPESGHGVGVHRTFLREDGSGKADIASPRRMLGRAGVIRLYEWQGDGLAIAEGIETSLAVAQHFEWLPIWACGSAGVMRGFPVLEHHALTIFSDPDETGRAAAAECAERWADAGMEVWVKTPPEGDFDDIKQRLAS